MGNKRPHACPWNLRQLLMGAINFVSQICVKQIKANLALKWSFFCWKGWLLWSKRLKCRRMCYSCSCSCMNEFHLKLNYHFHTLFRVNLIKAFLSKNVICRHFCLLSLSFFFSFSEVEIVVCIFDSKLSTFERHAFTGIESASTL